MAQRPIGKKKSIAVSCLIITLGVGWLLTAQAIMPGVDWVWVMGLGVVGVLVLVMGGLDKVTVVVGPFLIIATFLSILRQTGRLSAETEVPVLVIIVGVLTLVSTLLPLPGPRWLDAREEDS